MASTQHLPTLMENLPEDVLSDIFIRLLAKQLAQMRCVSKTWNALLSQSSFIKSDLHRSIHNTDKILLVFIDGEFHFDRKPFILHSSRTSQHELTNFIKLPINPHTTWTIIGSVNGLICFSYISDVGDIAVNIWNPSLSAMLNLPPYSKPFPRYTNLVQTHFRFGYDPKTDDYRVIKLMGIKPRLPRTSQLFYRHVPRDWLQIEVYSMRKGSWGLITQRFPSHVIGISKQSEVCVDGYDGHLHWFGYTDEERKEQTIMAFDLGTDTFCEIPLPDPILHHLGDRFNVLGVLAGKLCLMSRVKDGECEVWVMDEYGVAESWAKRHIISKSSGISPIGFTLHNELFFQNHNGLALYDPISAKVKRINTTTTLEVGMHKILDYVDSLVWIVPVKRDIKCFNISHFANLKRRISRMVNGPRATTSKTLDLLILFFLIFTFMMIFFGVRFVSST